MRYFLYKALIGVAVFFFASSNLNAQAYLMPTVGMNISTFNFNVEGYDNTANVGYQVGILGRAGKNAFFQTGVLYGEYSNNMYYTDSLTGVTEDVLKVKSILLPINVGFNLVNTDLIKFKLLAGVNLAFPIGIDENVFHIEKADFNTTSVAAAFGFGVDIYRFVLDASFSFGMNDMMKIDENTASLNLYTISIGYLIGGYNN